MAVKSSFRISKKRDSENGRTTDNEPQRSRPIENNWSDRIKNSYGRGRIDFDENQFQANLSCVKENQGRRNKRINP